MEVAGQWRRHWAGTAEYGKVTEGGVTTRVARAVEVMQANAPGARVRVMRAAYHQTAGPGAPATSFLMHSSRRVISSGFNMLESPSFPTKPLEISSMPLETSPERNAEENYEVTEPDDLDISEPSKWRSSTGDSVRMPSEESSSADNASIIDLDARHKNTSRKYSYDSENSEISFPRRASRVSPLFETSEDSQTLKYDSENSEIVFPRRSSRVSPLLESPEDLSTLKYKSLLTGSNDWNNRRKSYSFEDTAPLSESVLHSNDTIAMESSTDSGICKSTELVNDADDKYYERKERPYDKREETFKDWLSKNRGSSSFYKNSPIKSYRGHDAFLEDPLENNIALKSTGKLTITVPIKVDDDYEYKKSNMSDDSDRRAKKVEFCKTELHFAADSGKVNIIATDEKPPPANDFRKRRSAFVPIRGKFEEKPITLFGDTSKDFPGASISDFSSTSGTNDFDENTAATKSILKNKIPKPKPYLLGENMAFGHKYDSKITKENISNTDSAVPTAVALINRQLESQRRYSHENAGLANECIEPPCVKKNAYRTTQKGPSVNGGSERNTACENAESNVTERAAEKPVKNKIKILQMSPVLGRTKTRQLRESELTYFGVNNTEKDNTEKPTKEYRPKIENRYDDEFHSVRLIQKVSNSACNSEADSEEAHEYQNLPLDTNFAPIPRVRTKLEYKPQDLRVLQPVMEQDNDEHYTSRRSRHRREDSSNASRSISEPPKARYKIKEKSPRRYDHVKYSQLEKRSPTPRFEESQDIDNKAESKDRTKKRTEPRAPRRMLEEPEPLYVNLMVQEKLKPAEAITDSRHRSRQRNKPNDKTEHSTNLRKSEVIITDIQPSPVLSQNNDIPIPLVVPAHKETQPEKVRSKHGSLQESDKESQRNMQHNAEKRSRSHRTEKLATPEYSSDTLKQKIRDSSTRRKLSHDNIIEDKVPEFKSEKHRAHENKQNHGPNSEENRSRSSQRKLNVTRGSEEINKNGRKHKRIDAITDPEKASTQLQLSTPEYSSDTLKQKIRDSSSTRRKLSYDIIEDNVPEMNSEKNHRRSSEGNPNVTSRGIEEINKNLRKPKRIDAIVNPEIVSTQRIRHSSKDKTSKREPSNKSQSQHSVDTSSYDSRHNLSTPRINDSDSTEMLLNKTSGHKTKLNQYVINYDDKNGTVSSVCKVKPSSSTEKKKLVTNGVKDKSKDRKIKNKSPDRKVRK